jgi:hypothetical protein
VPDKKMGGSSDGARGPGTVELRRKRRWIGHHAAARLRNPRSRPGGHRPGSTVASRPRSMSGAAFLASKGFCRVTRVQNCHILRRCLSSRAIGVGI